MPQQQQEEKLNIGQYWQMIRHRKWWLMLALFVGWAVVTAISWIIPASYVSDSLILIQRQTLSDKVVPPNVQIDLQQRLDTMTQKVLSRTNLRRVIEKFKLYPEKNSSPTDEVIDLMRKDIKIELVLPGQGTRRGNDLTGFTVSYTGKTPTQAQQVTQELSGLFIQQNIQTTQDLNRGATDFLQTQLQDVQRQLVAEDAKVKAFKSQFIGELPEQLQSNIQILTGLQTQLGSAGEALNHAQQQELYLQSLLAQFGGSGKDDTTGGSAPAEIDQRLTTMRAELASLKKRYTDKHPDVIHLEEDIAATESLKKTMEKESLTNPDSSPAAAKGQSSIAQIKSQLKANELELATRKREVAGLERQIEAYQGRLNRTPIREQQLAGLERAYKQLSDNYNSLLEKKQNADLAADLVNQQQGDTLQLVDPANLPDKADFPNHFKFSLAGIGAGLALALILVGGRQLTNPVLYNEEQATIAVDAPILTAIPSLSTPSEKAQSKRRSIIQAIAAVLLLSLIPLGTVLAYYR